MSVTPRFRLSAVLAAAAWTAFPAAPPAGAADAPRKPNIVFILADDLGYGDLGCYGQKRIKTPNIDRLAAEGLRFTDCYAGATVCAPSRCALMTGLHTGHARVRGNARVPLKPADTTVAEILKSAGYATGLVGKWGLGDADTTGAPNKKGFDEAFGYLDQVHAHNYYPDHLWKNGEKVPLAGNVVVKGVAKERAQYSHDLFTREALGFIERRKDAPFFLYLAYTIPHANNEAGKLGMEVPDDAPYSKEDWPQPERNFAAMVTRLDADVGRLMAKLKELGLDENTYVFFTSDNGPHKEGGHDPAFFGSSGPLRGIKRDQTDGGIRVPMIVRRPGVVPAGKTSGQVWAFWDFLPTAAEIAGAAAPKGVDGASILAAIKGGEPRPHAPLYWEFHERGFSQAARIGNWKGVRTGVGRPLELYDLAEDIGEARNVASAHPEKAAEIEAFLKAARVESEDWPIKAAPVPKKKAEP